MSAHGLGLCGINLSSLIAEPFPENFNDAAAVPALF
jgi:hypothetical protein